MTNRLENTRRVIDQLITQRIRDFYILVDEEYKSYFLTEEGDEYLCGCYNLTGTQSGIFVPIQVYLDKIKELGK